MLHFAFCFAAAALLVSGTAQATVRISAGPSFPLSTDLTARARWGGNNFEGQLLSSGIGLPGTQLNGPGNPTWQLGQAHAFRMAWDSGTGTLTWGLDFNRDGSFGAGEVVSYLKPGGASTSYRYLSFTLATNSQGNGNHSNAIDIGGLTINGISFGDLSASNGGGLTQWFEPTGGTFRNVEAVGTIRFRNTNGNGAFAQERPNLNISFAGVEPVPEPASWTLLIAGFGLIGAVMRRQRAVASQHQPRQPLAPAPAARQLRSILQRDGKIAAAAALDR